MKRKAFRIVLALVLVLTLTLVASMAAVADDGEDGPRKGGIWGALSQLREDVFALVGDLQEQVEAIVAPTATDIEALGFVTGPHTPPPSAEDIEALGFVTAANLPMMVGFSYPDGIESITPVTVTIEKLSPYVVPPWGGPLCSQRLQPVHRRLG